MKKCSTKKKGIEVHCLPSSGFVSFSVESFSKDFCSRPVPGKTSMFTDFNSWFCKMSSGLKPKTAVHVSVSSDIAGIINFLIESERSAWK